MKRISLLLIVLLFSGDIQAASQPPAPSNAVIALPNKPQTTNTQQPAAEDQRGTGQSPLISTVMPTPKTPEDTANEEKDRKDKSVEKEDIRDFNDKLILIGWTQLVIFSFQLLVFGYQAYKLKQTVAAAGKQSIKLAQSTQAMVDIATTMNANLVLTKTIVKQQRKFSRAQMRAYLTVVIGSGVYQEREKDLRFEVKPLLKNTGFTPAHKVKYWAIANVLPHPLPVGFNFPEKNEAIGNYVLGSNHDLILNAIVIGNFFDDEVAQAVKEGRGDGRLYVWGKVSYEDVFRKPHFAKFCQSIYWVPDINKPGNFVVMGYYSDQYSDAD